MQQLTPDDFKLQKHFGIQAKSLILKKQTNKKNTDWTKSDDYVAAPLMTCTFSFTWY